MRKLSASDIKFWGIAGSVIILSSAGIATLWPLSLRLAHHESGRLAAEAANTTGAEAEVNYRLAVKLDPGNHAARLGLARTLLANDHADQALDQLALAGQGSDVQTLTIRTLIELGRTTQAANQASMLTTPPLTDSNLTLAALTYALSGRTDNATAVIPLVSSSETAQRIHHALASKTTLAAELYATGLPVSSSALLINLPSAPPRNYLLARIHYDRHTSTDLVQAADLLSSALSLNPTDIASRKLLIRIYQDQQNTAAMNQQTALLAKLQSGRP